MNGFFQPLALLRPCSAFLLWLLGSLSPLHAKPDKVPPITPSFAKPVKSVVFPGGEVEIPLRPNTPVRGTKYFIRSLPSRGDLGVILTTEDGLASVTYRHNAALGIGEDSFTYAVQTPGAAVSSRAKVEVLVINRPPRLEAPSEVDFGCVPVGSSSLRIVTLRNTGGELFSARMQFQPPWNSVIGRVEIPAGGSADVPVVFSPDTESSLSGTWFLEGGTNIRLLGTGVVILNVEPSFLKLQEAPGGERTANLTVANKTGEPIRVEFACPTGIREISPLVVEANGQTVVTVEAEARHASGGRTTMVVKENRASANVEILIPSLRARLVIDPSHALDFGEIQPGKSAVREITFGNAGGVPASVEISCPAWLLPDATRILVKPGEPCRLRIEAAATRPGMLRDRVTFKYDNIAEEIIVTASVSASPTSPPVPAAAPAQNTAAFDPAAIKQQALRIIGISQRNGIVAIRWQDPNPDPRTYRLESLQITSESSLSRQAAIAPDVGCETFSPDEFAAERLKFTKKFEEASNDDKVVKIWSPMEKADIQKSGEATFEAAFPFSPNQQTLRVRISSILADGSISPIQSEIRIPLRQSPSRHWTMMTVAFWLVGLACLAVIIRKFLR